MTNLQRRGTAEPPSSSVDANARGLGVGARIIAEAPRRQKQANTKLARPPIQIMPSVNQGDYPQKDASGTQTLQRGWTFMFLGNKFHILRTREIQLGAIVRLEGDISTTARWWVGWVVNLLSTEVRASWTLGKPLLWKSDGGAPFLDQEETQKGKGPWYDESAVTLLRGDTLDAPTVFVSDTPQINFAHYRENDPAKGELKSLRSTWRFAGWILARANDADPDDAASYHQLYAVSYSSFVQLKVVQGLKRRAGEDLSAAPLVGIDHSPLKWDRVKGIPNSPILSGTTANEATNATFPKELRPAQ